MHLCGKEREQELHERGFSRVVERVGKPRPAPRDLPSCLAELKVTFGSMIGET
jgi:hypothetical protein